MASGKLTTLALILAVAAGLLELYLAATSRPAEMRGSDLAHVLVFVLPLVMIAGGVILRMGNEVLGAGLVLVAVGIQHFLVDITSKHYLPVGLAVLAIVLAMYSEQVRNRAKNTA